MVRNVLWFHFIAKANLFGCSFHLHIKWTDMRVVLINSSILQQKPVYSLSPVFIIICSGMILQNINNSCRILNKYKTARGLQRVSEYRHSGDTIRYTCHRSLSHLLLSPYIIPDWLHLLQDFLFFGICGSGHMFDSCMIWVLLNSLLSCHYSHKPVDDLSRNNKTWYLYCSVKLVGPSITSMLRKTCQGVVMGDYVTCLAAYLTYFQTVCFHF